MNSSLSKILAFSIGSIITINGATMGVGKILAQAEHAANTANLHQLATILEIYYLDHNQYPEVKGGKELVNVLEKENYIQGRPLNADDFNYSFTKNGDDYELHLALGK